MNNSGGRREWTGMRHVPMGCEPSRHPKCHNAQEHARVHYSRPPLRALPCRASLGAALGGEVRTRGIGFTFSLK